MMGLEPNSMIFDGKESCVDNVGVKRNDLESDPTKELVDYRKRCVELEEERKKVEERCLVLEAEVEGLKKRNKELEEQVVSVRRVVGEGEKGKEGVVVDLTDEENDRDKLFWLEAENKVMQCEKERAQDEVKFWKEKIKELESRLNELESKVKSKAGNESSIGITHEVPPMTRRHLETNDGVVVGKENLQEASGVKHAVAENVNLQSSGTPDLPAEGERTILSGARRVCDSLVKKRLAFEEDGNPIKKMAPCTPAPAQLPFSDVIDISDEDSDSTSMPAFNAPKTEAPSVSEGHVLDDAFPENGSPLKNNIKTPEKSGEEAKDGCKGNSPVTFSAKRKRASNIVTSDSEGSESDDDNVPRNSPVTFSAKRKRAYNLVTSDSEGGESDDDNVPICTLRRRQIHGLSTDSEEEVEENGSRRRLLRLRKAKNNQDKKPFDPNKPVNLYGNTSGEDEDDSAEEADGLESEGDSLDGFIDDNTESASESSPSRDQPEDSLDDEPEGSLDDKPEDSLDDEQEDSLDDEPEDSLVDYKETLDRIGRKRGRTLKWDLEGDMLADFGKDPELCMKAVCCLYRQQTADEKMMKGTIYLNQRGFSQCDATRGTELAEFLTDGDSEGDLNKTVEELKKHDPKGVDLAVHLATKYSKQLFEIYQNEEDPYFRPLC